MSNLVETLGELDVYQHVEITVEDGTTVSGMASPIDYVPKESLRIEVDPEGEDVRYQFTSTYDDGEWGEVRAQQMTQGDEDWNDIGSVTAVDPGESEGESGDEVGAGK